MKLILQIAAGIVLAVAFISQPVIVGSLIGVFFVLAAVGQAVRIAFRAPTVEAPPPPADDSDLIGQRFLRWLRGK